MIKPNFSVCHDCLHSPRIGPRYVCVCVCCGQWCQTCSWSNFRWREITPNSRQHCLSVWIAEPKTQSHRYSAIPDYHQLTDKVEIRIMKSPRFDAGFVTSATVASMYGLTQHILNFIAFTHVWVSSPESDKESRESLFFICASFSVQLRLWKLQRTLTSSDTSQHRINVAKNQVVRQRDPEWAETNRMIESLRLSHLAMSSILSICHGGTYLVFLLGNSTKSTLGSPLAKIKWWQSWFIFQQFFASKGSAR